MDGNTMNKEQEQVRVTLEELVPELQNQISSLMLEVTVGKIVVKKLQDRIAELENSPKKTTNDF